MKGWSANTPRVKKSFIVEGGKKHCGATNMCGEEEEGSEFCSLLAQLNEDIIVNITEIRKRESDDKNSAITE